MAGIIITFADGQELRPHVTTNISPGRTSEVTENEVEDGSSVTDHRTTSPRTLSVSACVSDVHLDKTGTYDMEASGDHVNWRERLELADANGEFLTVDVGPTRGGTFENMLITSLDYAWDAESGNGFDFTLTLKEFRVAKPKVRNLTAERVAKERMAVLTDTLGGISAAGTSNGVLGGAGATLVDSQTTLSRFQPERGLGRLTTQAAPASLAGLADTITQPAGLSGNVFDFVNGGI